MFPVIFSVNSFSFYTLGFLLAVGFFLMAFFSWRRLRELGLNEESVIDFLIVFSLSSFIFSRLGYIFTNFDQFHLNFTRWFLLGKYPGLSYLGFLLGAGMCVVYWSKKKKWQFWQVTDELVFGVMPFSVLLFLGLFFDGSWVGSETSFWWGIFLSGGFIRRHPVPLIAAFLIFLVWILLLWVEKHWRTWKWCSRHREGLVTLLFATLTGVQAFLLAFLEEGGLYYLWIKRAVLLALFLLSLMVIIWRSLEVKKINIFKFKLKK